MPTSTKPPKAERPMLNLLLIVYAKLLLIVKKNLPTRCKAPCGTVPAGINGGCVNMAAVVQMTGKIAIIRIEYWWRKGLCLRSDKNSTDSKPAGATSKPDAHATPMDSVHDSIIRSLTIDSQEKTCGEVQSSTRDSTGRNQ